MRAKQREVIVGYFQGGLGNQLFQYVAFSEIARSKNKQLRADVSWFKTRKRDWHLPEILGNELPAERLLPHQLMQFRLLRKLSKNRKGPVFTTFPCPVYVDYGVTPNHSLRSLMSSIGTTYDVVGGLFQSAELVRCAKSVNSINNWRRRKLEDMSSALTKLSAQENVMALHLRLGDYKHSENLKIFGSMSPSYYRSAIKEMSSKYGVSQFFVFTDDADAAREILHGFDRLVWVCEFHLSLLEEFIFLSSFKRIAISNSTFAWWAAVLAAQDKNAQPKIIFPYPWYSKPTGADKELQYQGWLPIARG